MHEYRAACAGDRGFFIDRAYAPHKGIRSGAGALMSGFTGNVSGSIGVLSIAAIHSRAATHMLNVMRSGGAACECHHIARCWGISVGCLSAIIRQ
jgi:hypothetical protein